MEFGEAIKLTSSKNKVGLFDEKQFKATNNGGGGGESHC